MVVTFDLDSIISIAGLAVGSGAVFKLFHLSSQHGKYTLKVDTLWDAFIETSKAMGSEDGPVKHGSDYHIDLSELANMIESTGYIADPELVAYFRMLVVDPSTPTDDAELWRQIQQKWGMQRLIQEAARFGAKAAAVPGIWLLCIRAAQKDGADSVLKEIKVSK